MLIVVEVRATSVVATSMSAAIVQNCLTSYVVSIPSVYVMS